MDNPTHARRTVELTQDQLALLGCALLSEIDLLSRLAKSGRSSEDAQRDLQAAIELKTLLVRAAAGLA